MAGSGRFFIDREPAEKYSSATTHFFFINPVSFKSRDAIESFITSVDRAFAGLPGHRYNAVVSRFPRDAFGVVRRFAEGRERDGEGARIYAVGGDGIIFDCVNAAADFKNIEFGFVPYGGRCNFLGAFGAGAAPLFRDIARIVTSPSLPTDLLRVGGNYAINYATLGIESAAQARTLAVRKNLPKPLRKVRKVESALYPCYAMMTAFNKSMANQRYNISLDNTDYSGSYFSISVANGPCYGGNRYVCVSAVPNDGLMNVTLYKSLPPLRIARGLYTMGASNGLSTTAGRYEMATRRTAAKAVITSDTPILISLDGEMFYEMELTAEVVPAAVRVIAPGHLTYEKGSVH